MDGGFAGSLEFIRACKVLEPRQTLTNVCIKRTVQAILANLGLRKFFPLGRFVCRNVPQPPFFFSSRSFPHPHCWTLSSKVQRPSQRDSCKGLSSDLPKTRSNYSPARCPHRRMSLLHGRRFQSHPTYRGPELRSPTTPLEWTDSPCPTRGHWAG